MKPWDVRLHRPGFPSRIVPVEYLAPTLLQPAAYRSGLFLHIYRVTWIDMSKRTAVAMYDHLERSHTLSGLRMDPNRIPW